MHGKSTDMSRNTHLLFELIRVTIGRQNRFSRIPSSGEWQNLFELTQKHAIAGVTFAGVRKLQQNGVCIPSDAYWQWLGLASQVQQHNEVMNTLCVGKQSFRFARKILI